MISFHILSYSNCIHLQIQKNQNIKYTTNLPLFPMNPNILQCWTNLFSPNLIHFIDLHFSSNWKALSDLSPNFPPCSICQSFLKPISDLVGLFTWKSVELTEKSSHATFSTKFLRWGIWSFINAWQVIFLQTLFLPYYSLITHWILCFVLSVIFKTHLWSPELL